MYSNLCCNEINTYKKLMLPLRDFWVIGVFSLSSIQSANSIIFVLIKQRQNYMDYCKGKMFRKCF